MHTSESGINSTTAVGRYSPQGDSPFGCADMSGNVWEWTHSLKKRYPYNASDGRESEKVSDNRVLRGGSFSSSGRGARCAHRYDLDIDYLNLYYGFRVVVAPKLT